MLSRLHFAARVSLFVGCFSVLLGIVGGCITGLISGYCGGRIDLWLQRVMDVIMSLPAIVLALTILAGMGSGPINVVLAIAIPQLPRVTASYVAACCRKSNCRTSKRPG